MPIIAPSSVVYFNQPSGEPASIAMRFLTEADATPQSADWVIAHFALPYLHEPLEMLWRWRAYLKPGGMLFCTHFGPDTLEEWKEAAAHVLPNRMDMHELGDLLVHAGFTDPVLDTDYVYTRHRNVEDYLQELMLTHMIKETAQSKDIANEKSEWMTTYEIIFAHAFSNDTFGAMQDDTGTIVKIPVSKIGRVCNTS